MEIKENQTKKKKRNQLPYGIALLVVLILCGIWFAQKSPMLAIGWIFGIAFGFVLQKARFCFTASLRDPVLTGSTSLTRAVIIAFMIATVGFGAIQFNAFTQGKPIPGLISPAGIHTAIGATMFGIGMVIAGGCASGTLMRVGEGFMMQWLSLIFFVIGSIWGAKDFGWWTKAVISKTHPVWLPNVFGWPVAFFGQLALLAILYVVAEQFENRKINKSTTSMEG